MCCLTIPVKAIRPAAGPQWPARLPLRNSPFSQLSEQGPAILNQVQEATTRINQLLAEDNQRLLREALANIGQAAGSVNTLSQRLDRTVSQRLDPALAALPPLAHDASLALQSLQKAGNQVSIMAADIDQTVQRLNAPDGAMDQASRSAHRWRRRSIVLAPPPCRAWSARPTKRACARMVERAAAGVSDNPQGFLYGPGRGQPGPGETGFTPPLAQPAGQ